MGTESIDKAYATQIANIEKSTGKKLKEWITIINKSGFAKHGELVSFLKINMALLMVMQIRLSISPNKVMQELLKMIQIG